MCLSGNEVLGDKWSMEEVDIVKVLFFPSSSPIYCNLCQLHLQNISRSDFSPSLPLLLNHLLHLTNSKSLQTGLSNATFAHFSFIFPRGVEVILQNLILCHPSAQSLQWFLTSPQIKAGFLKWTEKGTRSLSCSLLPHFLP